MNDSTFYYKGYTFRLYSVGTSTTFLQVNKYNSNNIFEGNIEINNCFEKFNKFMINNQLEIEELTYEKIKLILKENERIIHTFDLSLKYNMRKIRIQIEEINLNLTDILTSLFFFSPNNTLPKKIICGNNNGVIKIFNDSFSQLLFNIKKAHNKSIYFFEIKDENSFFSCSDDMTIKLWDIRDINNINLIITIKGHNDSINKIIYLNKLLYSCSLDKSIIIYKENENSNNQYELSYTLKHKYEIFSFLLIINYSKNLLISSGADTTIIWEEKKYSIKDNKNNNEKEKLIYIEKKNI
jgi:WD40 repeat protein